MAQQDMFGPRAKPPVKYTDAQKLTAYFVKAWAAKFGVAYSVEPQDGRLLKDLATKHTMAGVERGIDRFFAAEWPDNSWVVQTGYSVSALARTWNQLTVAAARKKPSLVVPGCTHEPRCTTAVQHTKRYLEER